MTTERHKKQLKDGWKKYSEKEENTGKTKRKNSWKETFLKAVRTQDETGKSADEIHKTKEWLKNGFWQRTESNEKEKQKVLYRW